MVCLPGNKILLDAINMIVENVKNKFYGDSFLEPTGPKLLSKLISTTNQIVDLKHKGAQVYWHDDLVNEWNGEKSVALSSDFDLAIIATPHDYLDLTNLENVPILNTRGSI